MWDELGAATLALAAAAGPGGRDGVSGTLAAAAWPLAAYFAVVALIVVSMLGLSYVLGEHHAAPAKGEPYEGGVASTGSARIRFDARFYLVAMLFVVFDVEAAFVFAWAVAARALGWPGWIEVAVFIGVLLAALAYVWRERALDFAPRRSRAGAGS